METLFICKGCGLVMGCADVISSGVYICHGEYQNCIIKRCDIKNNPWRYNHYDIIDDGYCDSCYEQLLERRKNG